MMMEIFDPIRNKYFEGKFYFIFKLYTGGIERIIDAFI